MLKKENDLSKNQYKLKNVNILNLLKLKKKR